MLLRMKRKSVYLKKMTLSPKMTFLWREAFLRNLNLGIWAVKKWSTFVTKVISVCSSWLNDHLHWATFLRNILHKNATKILHKNYLWLVLARVWNNWRFSYSQKQLFRATCKVTLCNVLRNLQTIVYLHGSEFKEWQEKCSVLDLGGVTRNKLFTTHIKLIMIVFVWFVQKGSCYSFGCLNRVWTSL